MVLERLETLLGAGEEWQRPGPSARERRRDVGIAAAFFVVAAVGTELLRSVGAFRDVPVGVLEQYAAVGSAALFLIWRRSHPLPVAMAATTHLLVVGSLVPAVVSSLPMQVLYFFAIYSGVAWARDRRVATFVVIGVGIALFAWLAWFFALSSGVSELYGEAETEGEGPIPAVLGAAGWVILNNLLYFGGAVLLGQVAWRAALRTAQVVEQNRTIAAQAERLRDQAVVAERLRIARELHDVVAHHVSVMGVQAAAARRVLSTDTDAAQQALAEIEASSRDAVAQMRDLLGTLRTSEAEADAPTATPETATSTAPAGAPDRSPQPGLADLAGLVAQAESESSTVDLRLVPAGADVSDVAVPVQLSVYRIVQEALANVRRHSTARSVSVVVRIEPATNRVEVEVVDGGEPRHGTAGTGLGQLGMAERARHLGGGLEIGTRRGGGYRVRAWFPMDGARTHQAAPA